MASRSERMYSDSPKSERGDDGKTKVVRPSERVAKTKPKSDMAEMGDRHARELSEMHKRHEDEHKALNARHEKEAMAVQPPAAMTQGAEDPAATA